MTGYNRPNLSYEVREKNKNALDDVARQLRTKYRGQSGIVYCLSRDDCQKTSDKLRANGITSGYYHAGLSPTDRAKIQDDWMTNKIQVIAATIAFGMGIDKEDCRVVFHLVFSKSVENYYQESGRAGRDGKPGDCIIYYSFGDRARLQAIIEKSDKGRVDQNMHGVNAMVEYCENKFTCRRKILIAHFQQEFDEAECNKGCDNCKAQRKSNLVDFSEVAEKIVETIGYSSQNYTVVKLRDTLKGKNVKNLRDDGLKGLLKQYNEDTI